MAFASLAFQFFWDVSKATLCKKPVNSIYTAIPISFLQSEYAQIRSGYQLLSETSGVPKEYQYPRVVIKTEESRLLNWAYVIQLDEREENLLIAQSNEQTNKSTFLEFLEEQRKLLMRFGNLDDKYKPLSTPLIQDVLNVAKRLNDDFTAYADEGPALELKRAGSTFHDRFARSKDLLTKALACVKSTQQFPAWLKWATFDKEAMKKLITRLGIMNEYMESMLTQQQMGELLKC